MTKHNFVKLVWNVNNWIAQKTDKSRLVVGTLLPRRPQTVLVVF